MFQTLIAHWFAPVLTALAMLLMSVLTIRTWNNRGFRLRVILSWCVFALSIASGLLCIYWATESTKKGLEHRLSNLAKTMSTSLEEMGHANITLETGADDPTYRAIMACMREWMRRVPSMASVYTIRLDSEGNFIFIADPEADLNRNGRIDEGEEDLAIGTLYGDSYVDVPEFIDAFEGRSGFNKIPIRDEYGIWVTAAEPMYDKDGRVEAILGVDFWGEQWVNDVNASRFWPTLFYSSFLALFFAVQFFLSNHQRIEEKLKRNADDLERSVEQLVESNKKADAAVKAKDEFLANMSHEIRTPMNAILGMIHLVQKTGLTEKQLSYLENAEQSTKLLLRVINDILDFSKIEAGKLEIESVVFSLKKTFADLHGLIDESARKKNLELVFEIPENIPDQLVGDSVRLSQVIVNLLSNAIKFTEQGTVDVSVRKEECRNDEVKLRFTVQDTGIGMSEEEIDKLFLPFSQADASMTRKYGGTGLGLAISKSLVGMMHGEIGCQSREGQGSLFYFTVVFGLPRKVGEPVAPTRSELESPERKTPRQIRRARILLVEDNKVNQLVAVELLTMEGFAIDVADNGAKALGMIENNHYDLVLMDIQMPEMDGFEATRRIRSNPRYASLPILAMTAHAMSSDHEKSLEAGMNDHITKPIDPEKLYQTIAKWLNVV